MTVLIELVCSECGCIVACLFNQQEGTIEGPDQIDCPGTGCSNVHRVYGKYIDEEKASEFRRQDYDPSHFW